MTYKNNSTGQIISDVDYDRLPNDKKRKFSKIDEGQEGRKDDTRGDDILDTMIGMGILSSISGDSPSYDSGSSSSSDSSSDFGGFDGGDGGGGGASGDF